MYYYAEKRKCFPIYGNTVKYKAVKGKGLVPYFELQIDTSYNSLERENKNKFYSNLQKESTRLYRPFITSDFIFKLLSKAAITV